MNLYYLADYDNPKFNAGLYNILSYYISNNPDKKISIHEQLHLDDFYNIINDENSYVLISISFFSEFWKLDEIMKILRKLQVKKYNLVVGGSAIVHFYYDELIKYYPELDFVVEGKGELILEGILNKKLQPGFHKDNLTKIPTYLLSDFFVKKLPNTSIPIAFTGTNCVWDKCDFCHHHDKDGHNNTPDEIFNLIKYYYTKYNKRDFFITDNYLILQNFYKLLDMLISEGMNDVQFDGIGMHIQANYKRLGDYVDKFSRPIFGPRMGWGIEFLDDEVLAMYHKGTTVDKIFEHAKFMNDINMPFHAFMLLGLPNLSNKNIQNGLDNLIKYYDMFKTCGLSHFALDSNMRMFNEPEKWNIQILSRIPLNLQFDSVYPIKTRVHNYKVFDLDNKEWISREKYLDKFYQHEELLCKKSLTTEEIREHEKRNIN